MQRLYQLKVWSSTLAQMFSKEFSFYCKFPTQNLATFHQIMSLAFFIFILISPITYLIIHWKLFHTRFLGTKISDRKSKAKQHG